MPKTLIRKCSSCGHPCRFEKKWYKSTLRVNGDTGSSATCRDCLVPVLKESDLYGGKDCLNLRLR